jgi:hypothetical protein
MFRFSCFKVEASEGTMSTLQPDSSDHAGRGSAGQREKIKREVVCKICQAVYVPSRAHRRLASSSQAVVESTFMSMCHFCFRCRRPACPSCWDEVHGVCGACALEAQLPFRSSVPPLDGVIFPPIQHLPLARVRAGTPPLVCVQPGSFQRAPLPIEAQTTLYLQTILDQPIDDASRTDLPPQTSISSPKPQPHVIDDIADVATRPEKRGVQRQATSRKVTTRRDKLGRIVIEILLVIVLLTVCLILSALLFPGVNDVIAQILHVDIRSEIAYLLELIQHLF